MPRTITLGDYDDIHRFGVRLVLTHYDYRPRAGIMWNISSTSACGRSRVAHWGYFPMIPFYVARRWRRFGLMYAERAWRGLVYWIIGGY